MSDLIITGVIDGDLPGGFPKAIELLALNDVPELSDYALGNANGGAGGGRPTTQLSGSAEAGDFIYVTLDAISFESFFGFPPDIVGARAALVDGDDAVELFQSGVPVDVFGDVAQDGTGQPWDYENGWAYRKDDALTPSTTFNPDDWTYSGPGALAGETSNAGAATPFPAGSVSATADVILLETFDDADDFSASSAFFNDGAGFLGLNDGAGGGQYGGDTPPTAAKAYEGFDGGYLEGLNLVSGGRPTPFVATWSGLDIAGQFDLTFAGDFAAAVDGGGDIDSDDFILVEAAIDGGAFQTILSFRAAGDGVDSVFAIDGNGDGVGDGPALSAEALRVEAAIAGNGATLDLRLTASVDGPMEDFAVDNFIVDGGAAPALTVALDPAAISENGGAATGTVTRSGDLSEALTVTLASDDPSEATVVAAIEILAGEASASFAISAVDDAMLDGARAVQISAAAAGLVSGAATLTVLDDETADATIMAAQGAGHETPLAGAMQILGGIVTAFDGTGFYLQDAIGDGDDATSDAIFVETAGIPAVVIGDRALVSGQIAEFTTPGGTGRLSETHILANTIVVESQGDPLPAPVVLGAAGRTPPAANFDDDAFASFDPQTDGLDFFEALEGMRVEARDLTVIAPTDANGALYAVVDQGAGASGLSATGALAVSDGDFNPERIKIAGAPEADVGDLLGDVSGVIAYRDGAYVLLPDAPLTVQTPADAAPAVATLADGADTLTVASYDLGGLDPSDSVGRDAFAAHIVAHLNAPDVLALQSILDDSGAAGDGVLVATENLASLVDAIVAAGGPLYAAIDNPFIVEGASGDAGNPRNVFLYDPARVELVQGSLRPVGEQGLGDSFNGAPLPLAADFKLNGEVVTLVNVSLSPNGGAAPPFGSSQDFAARQEDPTVNAALDQRRTQAQEINDFVDGVLAADAGAHVSVLGGFQDPAFLSPLEIATGAATSSADGQAVLPGGAPILENLLDMLPEMERFTTMEAGAAIAHGHVLATAGLAGGATLEAVRINTLFADAEAAHDPLLVAFADLRQEEPFTERRDHPNNHAFSSYDFAGDDVLSALGGDDVVLAGAGDDIIDGGAGDDFIRGDAGDDVIDGGIGDDLMVGGIGDDTYFVDSAGDEVRENPTHAGVDHVMSSVSFVLKSGTENLTLTGDADIDGEGRIDDNHIVGNGGQNRLFGERGDDTLEGAGGDDELLGYLGADRLDGGEGRDRLFGQEGDDVLIGGAGGDVFLFRPGDGDDVIEDFGLAEDVIRFIDPTFAAADLTLADIDGALRLTTPDGDAITLAGLAGVALEDLSLNFGPDA